MGLDVSGKIIVGILFKKHAFKVEKTYYDKITGKPYKDYEEHEVWDAKGCMPITTEQAEEVSYSAKMQYYCNYEEDDDDGMIYGVLISETDLRCLNNWYIDEVDLDKITHTMFEMKQKYPNAEVKLYNFLSYSC